MYSILKNGTLLQLLCACMFQFSFDGDKLKLLIKGKRPLSLVTLLNVLCQG